MSETINQVMINAVTGERITIQLKLRPGFTVEEARAFLTERKEAGKQIDPDNCVGTKIYGQVLDPYDIFEVPDEWSCVGGQSFVRNLPDGDWVCFGDLLEDIRKTVRERSEQIEKRSANLTSGNDASLHLEEPR